MAEWVELPPRRTPGPGANNPLWDELKTRPGKWAVYARGASNALAANTAKRHPGYECTQRVDETGKQTVYVRWVGP